MTLGLVGVFASNASTATAEFATNKTWKPTIPIALPIPLPTDPNEITFANILDHVTEIPEAAWNKIHQEADNSQRRSIPVKLYVGPTTNTTKAQILDLLGLEMRLMNNIKQPRKLIALAYNGADVSWAESKWRKVVRVENLGINPNSYLGHLRAGCTKGVECWGGMAVDIGTSGDIVVFLGVQEPHWTVDKQNNGPMSQVLHEYTHAVQFSQWIGKSNALSSAMHAVVPCWWQEGQANAIGIGVWAPDVSTYQAVRDYNVTRPVNPKGPRPALVDFDKKAFTKFLNQDPLKCSHPKTNGDYQFGFSVGFAAVEALIAIGGARATMAVLKRAAVGESWATAFKAVYGVKWSIARDILASVLTAEYAETPLRTE